jgi:betaine-aldehyde dehydrogenase
MARLVEGARKLRIGDPLNHETHMGPLISQAHRESVERHVAKGLEDGGRLLVGGERPQGELYEKGFYFQPTIIEGVMNSATICQEEVFGPVLVAMPFDDETDLIEQANDSVFGLAAGIWSGDYKRIWRIARALETGTVWINTYKLFSISTPFSGWKESGMGREKGRLGIREYMQQKSLYWGMNEAPIAWTK